MRKIPKVFKVKQTSPHGQILFTRKSMIPNAYKTVTKKVPPHTKAEP